MEELKWEHLTDVQGRFEADILKAYFEDDIPYKELENAKKKICLYTATIWLRFAKTPSSYDIDAELYSPHLKRSDTIPHIRTDSKEELRAFALSFYKEYLDRNSPSA